MLLGIIEWYVLVWAYLSKLHKGEDGGKYYYFIRIIVSYYSCKKERDRGIHDLYSIYVQDTT